MISVIVYGRNDEHGYNLHKRAALSLNSIAENLCETGDEIVFVDWNTDASRPPFLVAIRDLLSDRARKLIRIVVVPPDVHRLVTDGKTRLPVAEPIARNVGVRHADPRNPWLLSTNTDVMLGGDGPRLSEMASTLAPGFFTAPRYEVPEWMWEGLSRRDSTESQGVIDSWASGDLPLAVVRSYEGFTFDGGGDFQLFHRSAFEAIGGFDETMLKGWHVDSNFAKRMLQHCGQVGEILGDPKVLHANHNRTYTQYTARRHESNDLEKYFFGPVQTTALSGVTGWGLPDIWLREIELDRYDELADVLADLALRKQVDLVHTSASDSASRLAGVDYTVTLPFLLDVAMCGHGIGKIEYLGTRAQFGLALAKASGALERVNYSNSQTESSGTSTLVVVDCTPTSSSPDARQLSDLSKKDRRDFAEILQSLRLMVSTAYGEDDSRTLFAFVNFEGNELTSMARSIVGDNKAQYYARLRMGPLRPRPAVGTRVRAKMARLVLRMASASGLSPALKRLSGMEPDIGPQKTRRQFTPTRVRGIFEYRSGLRRFSRRAFPANVRSLVSRLRNSVFKVVPSATSFARRLAFSRTRSWLAQTAALDPIFQIPVALCADDETQGD